VILLIGDTPNPRGIPYLTYGINAANVGVDLAALDPAPALAALARRGIAALQEYRLERLHERRGWSR
jgi:hypothetical protein